MTTAASELRYLPIVELGDNYSLLWIVGAAFFTLWFWLLPSWLGFRIETAGVARGDGSLPFHQYWASQWHYAAYGILAAPDTVRPRLWLPPRSWLWSGFYSYVRNPMYLGFFTGWIGLWIVFGHANPAAIAVACAVVIGVAVFVRLYEEPTLRKMFWRRL